MKKKVLVLGGGVAGMTAAHELAERGYDVTLFEKRPSIAGGKARTEPALGTGTEGRKDLPGEHGFRFFPGFYEHVPDTMRRIPFPGNDNGVFDNLVTAHEGVFAPLAPKPWFKTLAHFPTNLDQLETLYQIPDHLRSVGLTDEDFSHFISKMVQLMTSCKARRMHEYGRISWWQFIDAENRSRDFQLYLATGITRNAVAIKAELANTRTVGEIGVQLMLNTMTPGETSDRVLVGPTNDVWIDPWLRHLLDLGVDWRFGSTIERLDFDEATKTIAGVTVRAADGTTTTHTADFYVSALPVEVLAPLIPASMKAYDNVLVHLDALASQVSWMTGIQYFLTDELHIAEGHVNCIGTPWAVTCVTEEQFWPAFDLDDYGDGTIKSILSVYISDWDTPGMPGGPANGKIAKDCTPDEIAAETWHQMQQSLNTGGHTLLTTYKSYWLDSSIEMAPPGAPHAVVNLEPLLVNAINSWELRPEAYCRVENFFIAGDFVRTNVDFASMEGANEAARRAVNALLIQDDFTGVEGLCSIYDLHEPEIFEPLRDLDKLRYDKGMPWASPFEIHEDVARGVKKEVYDAIVDGNRLLRNLNPRRVLERTHATISSFLGNDDPTLAERADRIITRNANREDITFPDRDWVSFQTWTDLLLCHWPVETADLRSLVPAPLEIDTFQGQAWVSLVPMFMDEVAFPLIGEIPGGSDFTELNYRTYVHYKGRRGVYFFHIGCPDVMATVAARAFFYTQFQIATQTMDKRPDGSVAFASQRTFPDTPDARFAVQYTPKPDVFRAAPDSRTTFLTERYSSYAVDDQGRVFRGDLVHDSWELQNVDVHIATNTILQVDNLVPQIHTPKAHYRSRVEAVLWGFEEVT